MKNRIVNINARLFVTLLSFSLCYSFNISILHYIGMIPALVLLLLTIVSYCLYIKREYSFVFIVLLFIYFVIISSWGDVSNTWYQICMQLIMFIFPCVLLKSSLDKKTLERISCFFSRLFLLLVFIILGLQISIGEMAVLDYLGGTLLKVFFVLSFFFVLRRKNILLFILLAAFLNMIIGERTASLVLICVYVFYKLLSLDMVAKHKWIYNSLFWVVVMGVISFPFFYIYLKHSDIGIELNSLSREYTNGNFFSGRENIWEAILIANRETFLMGKGVANNFLSEMGTELSTHNLYMFLYLEGGVLLLLLFVMFMYHIWQKYYSTIKNRATQMSASFFLGILLFLDFELLLLVNNLVVSLFFWFVICFGLMATKQKCVGKLGQVAIQYEKFQR